jgi:DNA-binding NarL/FixJ family response regulator
MRILIVEDDHLQLEDIRAALGARYPQAEISEIRTEQEFRDKVDEIVAKPPDVVILDAMIRLTRRQRSQPTQVDEDSQNAGFRCVRLLSERNARIPVILVTMLDRKDLVGDAPDRDRLVILEKEASFANLIRQIDQFVPAGS